MAELADAQRSGRCLGDQVQVRILLGASVSIGKRPVMGVFFYGKKIGVAVMTATPIEHRQSFFEIV